MQNCPYCAEKVQDQAVVCKHCKNSLPALPKPRICKDCGKEDKSIIGIRCSACGVVRKSAPVAVLLTAILLPVFLFSCFSLLTSEPIKSAPKPSTTQTTPPRDPEYGRGITIQVCTKMYVEGMLVSPRSVKYPWVLPEDIVTKVSEGNYRVRSYLDAENAFGAMIRAYYTCDVTLSAEECSNVVCEFDD